MRDSKAVFQLLDFAPPKHPPTTPRPYLKPEECKGCAVESVRFIEGCFLAACFGVVFWGVVAWAIRAVL